jgi:uncharacterized membrane protein
MSFSPEAGSSSSPQDQSVDRNLAFLAYGLLFFSIFFAGAPALVAVAIAYARRAEAPPLIRSHHAFQIVIFGTAFFLALAAGICLLTAALAALGAVWQAVTHEGWNHIDTYSIDLSDVHVGAGSIGLAISALVLTALTAVWLVVTSTFGALRLASGRPIRQSGTNRSN